MSILEKFQTFLYRDRVSLLNKDDDLDHPLLDQLRETFEQSLTDDEFNSWQNNGWISLVDIPLNALDQQRVLNKLAQRTCFRGDVLDDDETQFAIGSTGALYFTHDESTAEHYAGQQGNIYLAHITPKNPLFVQNTDCTYDMEGSAALQEVIDAGYDCIYPLDDGDMVILSLDAIKPHQYFKKPTPWYHGTPDFFNAFTALDDSGVGIAHRQDQRAAWSDTGDVDALIHISPTMIEAIKAHILSQKGSLTPWVDAIKMSNPAFDIDDPTSYQHGIQATNGFMVTSHLDGNYEHINLFGDPLDPVDLDAAVQAAKNKGFNGVQFYNVGNGGIAHPNLTECHAFTFDPQCIKPYPTDIITPVTLAHQHDVERLLPHLEDAARRGLDLQAACAQSGIFANEMDDRIRQTLAHSDTDDLASLARNLVCYEKMSRINIPAVQFTLSEPSELTQASPRLSR